MKKEDRELIKSLIASIGHLTAAVHSMPRSITTYPHDYRPSGAWGQAGSGSGYGGGGTSGAGGSGLSGGVVSITGGGSR